MIKRYLTSLILTVALCGLIFFAIIFQYNQTKIAKKETYPMASDLIDDVETLEAWSNNNNDGDKITTETSEKSEYALNLERGFFSDNFSISGSLEESGDMARSSNEAWWLNSGAYLYIKDGIAETVHGSLEKGSKWQIDYRNYNSDETDNGYHPQNIFRLVTRSKWLDFEQEAYFRITGNNLSKSKHRMESNGLLLFNRYQDGDNLYYTGIRVDGFAVIKKKIKGKYFTMAYDPVYRGKYDRKKKPNLLPKNTWIGLRSIIKNEPGGSVSIKVFLDKNRNGNWELIAEAKDDGKQYGGKAFLNEGYTGIRTDFMDVEFDDYRIEEID